MPAVITIGEILTIFRILCDNNGSLLLDAVSPEHYAERFERGVRYLREAPAIYIYIYIYIYTYIYILRRYSYESDRTLFFGADSP